MALRHLAAAALLATAAPAFAADEPCQLKQFLELPVTMRGSRPMVTTQIAGKEAQFILDSGAFYSTMSRASAAAFGLHVEPAPGNLRLRGINGDTTAYMTTVSSFGLNGITLPHIDFLVGGTDTNQAGLLGQNFLGIGDVEYDLPHGRVHLFRTSTCPLMALPYWAGTKPVTIVPLEDHATAGFHTVGTITLNGVKLRAAFDSGAVSSILTMAAARRAGVTPSTPGVTSAGISTGLGTSAEKTWVATFRSIDIGGEAIPAPRIAFADIMLGGDVDMLIGVDFFLTHRMYVANRARKMLVTYEGGPVFGIRGARAVDAAGKPLDMTDTGAVPTDAEGFARRGAALASNHKLDDALADLDKAVALAPNEERYYRLRGLIHAANRQPLLAAADIDKALSIDPNDSEALFARAAMRIVARDPAGATADIRTLDKVLPPSAGPRIRLAGMADAVGLLDLAIANDDAWLKAHPEDAERPAALNGRCWARGQLNRELDKALDDCNAAIRARPGNAAYLDSRALIRLRRGELPQALADYDAALQAAPKNAWSLYVRGIVKQKMGDAAGADADRKAGLALAPAVGDRAKKLGLES